MVQCIVCFGSQTGLRSGDNFVSTNNGHVFHYCCALEFVAAGSYFCPLCDEDLRYHTYRKLSSHGCHVPERPIQPACSPYPAATMGTNSGRHSLTPTPTGIASNGNDPWLLDGRQAAAVSQTSPSYRAEPNYAFKIVVLGDFNVGKSSLLQRYADDRFDPIIRSTVGCDFRVKVLDIAGQLVRLNLWDTAGQERHRAVVDMYLRRADGIIFCFDITDTESFLSLQSWYESAQWSTSSDTMKIIVGTKSDLWQQRAVRSSQIRDLAERWNAQYIFTSAKDATNVEVVFRSIAALILENRLPSEFNNASTMPSAPLISEPQQHGIIRLSGLGKYTKKQKKCKKVDDCCA